MPESSFQPESSLQRARIVVVEHDEAEAARLNAALSMVGDVTIATAMKPALRVLASAAADLVLLSLPLPDAEDVSAVEDLFLAANGRPVIARVDVDDDKRTQLVVRGARDVIARGVRAEELRGLIGDHLAARDRDAESAEQSGYLRAVLSAVEGAVMVHSPSGRMIAVNDAAVRLLVMPIDKVLYELPSGRSANMYSPSGEQLSIEDAPLLRAMRTAKIERANMRVENAEGFGRWIESTATPLLRPGDPRPYGIVQTFRDVSEVHEAREALRAAHERELALLEHSTEGYLVLNAEGFVTDASPALTERYAVELFGAPEGSSIIDPDDLELATAGFLAAIEGETRVIEVRIIDRQGVGHWMECTLTNRMDIASVNGVVANLRDVTLRHEGVEKLAQLSAIVEQSADAIYTTDLDGVVTTWNAASEVLYGYSAEETIGVSLLDLIYPEDVRSEFVAIRAQIGEGRASDIFDRVRRRKDGQEIVVALKVSPAYDAQHNLTGASTIARDVTEARRLAAAQRVAEERFRLGFERAAIGIAMIDFSLNLVRVNNALSQMLGITEKEMVGETTGRFIHPEDRQASLELLADLVSGRAETLRTDRRFLHADGSPVWVTVQVVVVHGHDGDPPYLFAQIQDITDRKRGEEALAHLALHDALTGLPNRALLDERLAAALGRGGRSGKLVAVLFLDIDRFKLVNDGLGHVAGDQLLIDIASRLVQGVRPSDTVARFGGDEFIVLLEGVVDVADAEARVARVMALYEEPFTVEGQRLFVSVSCGIVVAGPGSRSGEILRDADAAMYRAKALGGSRIEVFGEALRKDVARRYDIERELAFALERNELAVAYQPIMSIAGDKIVGVEALVRWNSPEWGPLLPGQFIQAAEETGLVVPIGEFVMSHSLEQVLIWREQLDLDELWVSVNISARSLATGDPLARCAGQLQRIGAPPNALRLELTESTVMRDVEPTIAYLRGLRELGVAIAIDDFGTGLSSLSYLSRLPVEMLKVDQSLAAAPESRLSDSAIVQAIASLANTLGLELCAEGVESEAQRAALERLGCHLGQGYFFAPPMAPGQFMAWAIARRAKAKSS